MSYNYSKTQIFLLEFIVVVLFLTICTTICVSVFIKADSISSHSQRDLSAMIIAQNAAESFKANGASITEEATIFYDEEFNIAEKSTSPYIMKVSIVKEKQGILTGEISIYEQNKAEAFYSLKVDKYIGGPK